jgi:hypothetical protein
VRESAPREGVQLSGPRKILAGNEVNAFPSVVAGARAVVFASDHDGSTALNLWEHELATGKLAQLTNTPHDETEPAVSPDGKWIAYRSTAEGGGVYLQERATGKSVLLGEHGLAPKFSPDGERLLFWVPDPFSGHGKVYAKEMDGQIEADQKARGFADVHDAIWMWDSQHILFCGTKRSGVPELEHDIWVAAPDGDLAVKTGAFEILRKQGIALHSITMRSTPFALARGGVLLETWAGGMPDLWYLALDGESYLAKGPAVRLHPGAQASVAGDTVAFSLPESNVDIWSFPLDGASRKVNGAGRRLTTDPSDDIGSRTESEEAPIVFMSNRGRNVANRAPILATRWSAFVRFGDGTEREITPDMSPSRGLILDGARGVAYYRVLEGPQPSKQVIYRTPIAGGNREKICDDCGTLTDINRTTGELLYETPMERNRLALFNPATKQHTELLRHSDGAVRAARLSPNGKWLAFQVDYGKGTRRLYVAPYRGAQAIPFGEWVAATSPEWVIEDPTWAPDGRGIYYLTHAQDGKPAVYSVGFDPERGLTGKAPVEALRFPRLGFSILRPTGMKSLWAGLSVTEKSLILSVRKLESSLWVGTLR